MISYYYAETLHNVTAALLDKFKSVSVNHYAKGTTTIVKTIAVPITFAPVEKHHQDRTEDFSAEPESSGRRYHLQVPRMALILSGIQYSPDRVIGPNEYRYFQDVDGDNNLVNQVFRDYQPTPYNLVFTLFIRADLMTDFSQIIENILPYFNPKLYLRVKEFSFLNIERDLQVVLNDVAPDFSDELDKNSQRQMNGSITFTVEGWMYRPISYSDIVKIIHTRFWIGDTGNLSAFMDKHISLSAFEVTAVGEPPIGIPESYQMSGADRSLSAYYYLDSHTTSAISV